MKSSLYVIAAAVFVGASAGAHAQIEGTLFTQPEERAYLDYLRDEFLRNNAERGFDIEEATIPVIPGDDVAAPAGPTEFSFGGIMTRRDDTRSLWLNGAVLAERDLPAGMSLVAADRGTALRIAHEGKVYVLRPGQTVDLVAGNVMESYQRMQATPAVGDDTASQPALDGAASDAAALENQRLARQSEEDEADEAADDEP